jgi:hypothetical protein
MGREGRGGREGQKAIARDNTVGDTADLAGEPPLVNGQR